MLDNIDDGTGSKLRSSKDMPHVKPSKEDPNPNRRPSKEGSPSKKGSPSNKGSPDKKEKAKRAATAPELGT